LRAHLLTRLLAVVWLGIIGVIGAGYAGVAAALSPAAALLNYNGGVISPVSVFGAVTLLWLIVDWRLSSVRRARENKVILSDKPGLAKDKRALARERRVREKELLLQKREEKALRAENLAKKKKTVKDGERESAMERRVATIEAKKTELRERKAVGRR
jgi:hypothetical protein